MNQPHVTLILIPEFWRHSLVISQHNAKTPEKKSVLLRPATRSGYSIFFVISIISVSYTHLTLPTKLEV